MFLFSNKSKNEYNKIPDNENNLNEKENIINQDNNNINKEKNINSIEVLKRELEKDEYKPIDEFIQEDIKLYSEITKDENIYKVEENHIGENEKSEDKIYNNDNINEINDIIEKMNIKDDNQKKLIIKKKIKILMTKKNQMKFYVKKINLQ